MRLHIYIIFPVNLLNFCQSGPDRSCFYHAISYHLFEENSNHHQKICEGCIKHITEHPEEFEPLFDEESGDIETMIENASKNNAWADNYIQNTCCCPAI